MNILVLLSSVRGAASVSNKLVQALTDKLKEANPNSTVKERNLSADPLILGALYMPSVSQEEQPKMAALSTQLLDELKAADVLIIGLGLYNYGVPATLKAWMDQVCLAGITFRYNEEGQQIGLLTGKKAYIAIASGGVFQNSPLASWEHATPHLRTVLGSIGITDVTIFRAEGNGVPGIKETTLQKAIESIVL
ncbi:NAD(P)H-dependent oxidoreductase [soil metagenome]